ncbi:MAG: hypothetical protein LV473_22410, partial [Nitrospira sp.]|nr:hypothetical protein [Nitrospira sp.]
EVWLVHVQPKGYAAFILFPHLKMIPLKGTLMRTEGEYYYIKDNDGKEQKIHVDKSTKLDKVLPGDMVKAYVTDQGHTTTLERVN